MKHVLNTLLSESKTMKILFRSFFLVFTLLSLIACVSVGNESGSSKSIKWVGITDQDVMDVFIIPDNKFTNFDVNFHKKENTREASYKINVTYQKSLTRKDFALLKNSLNEIAPQGELTMITNPK